jgi:hypothetical protein
MRALFNARIIFSVMLKFNYLWLKCDRLHQGKIRDNIGYTVMRPTDIFP